MKNTDNTQNNTENINDTINAENSEMIDVSSEQEAVEDNIEQELSKDELKRKKRAVKKAVKESKKDNEPFNLKKEIWEWTYTIVIALAVAFLIKTFIFDVVKVDGESMYPTLHHKDNLIVTKLGYKPQQGDIIILDSRYKKREEYKKEYAQAKGGELSFLDEISFKMDLPKRLEPEYYVKRIIALPGQTVDIKDDQVYVDGQPLDEPYAHYDGLPKNIEIELPVTVEEDCVFVMGDNRYNSTDSRSASLGQVPYDAILGKSQIRILPLNNIGLTK